MARHSSLRLVSLVLLGLGGCRPGDTDCTPENHCTTESGAAECEPGYTWEEPGSATSFRCVPEPHASAPSCVMQAFEAPTARCSPAAGACLDAAQNQAEWQGCIEAEPACSRCINESYSHCVIGTPAEPGHCASAYGCYAGCVLAHCGPTPDDACTAAVEAALCSNRTEAMVSCYDPASPANDACAERAYDTCLPQSACGNGIVDAGETCDGNCPVSCPASTDPCFTWWPTGHSSTCNTACTLTEIAGCDDCPLNASPSEATGASIFSGDFLDRRDEFTGGDCGLFGRDAVYAWRAPAAGVYEFTMFSRRRFRSFGDVIDSTTAEGSIEILAGLQCSVSASSLGCDYAANSSSWMRLPLTAGQEVLIVGSNYVDTDDSDGSYDISVEYEIWVDTCTPSCSGRECGDDGCGGSCGSCSSGESCSVGLCRCVPSCMGRSCGDDGCGGSCGSCYGGDTCTASGHCSCTPSCAGRECGSNGCGGSCGSCALGSTCSLGACVSNPDACDPVGDVGCASPNQCWLMANETTRCALTGSGLRGDWCSTTSDCSGGYGCIQSECRKICERSTDAGCFSGEVCNGVSGWVTYGACATPP